MKKINISLLISVIILSLFGLLMIYSSSSIWAEYKFNDPYKYLKSQSIFLILGYIIIYIISKIDYRIYKKYSNHFLITCIILLILVLIPGIGTIRNGSRSWFGIGSLGIQPSEFAKLGLIIFTSKYLTNNPNKEKNKFKIKKKKIKKRKLKKLKIKIKEKKEKSNILPILFIVFLIFGLIMLQPDFGTGIILVITIVSLLFISGVNMNFFIKIGIFGLIGIVILVIIAPYRLARITSFLNPWSDPLGSGFQIIQSLYAIGPGGLLGMGLGNSVQKHFYLPEPQTDFIFAIISEELGFAGVLIISALFINIIRQGIRTSLKQTDNFAKYLSFGIIFSIAFQTILNLMVVTGLIPVTGVTLPFLSYGGSSLLVSMAEIGIILNISKNN